MEDARAQFARLAWQPYFHNPSLPYLLEGAGESHVLIIWGAQDRVVPRSAVEKYNQVIKGILGQINTSIQTVETITTKPATAVLALAIAIMGVMTLFGNMDMAVFLSFAIRAAIVMAFIQVGNTYYRDWIEAFVLGLPDYFAQAFSLTGSGGSPQQLFDGVLNGWIADALSVWHSSPWSFKAIFIGFCLAAATVLIVIPSLVAMFTVFLISSFLLMVMLAIGPLMILALLFRTTHRFLHGYVNVMVTGAIFALVVDIVLGIFSSTLTQVMANFKPSGSPDTDLPGIFGLAIVILLFRMRKTASADHVDWLKG